MSKTSTAKADELETSQEGVEKTAVVNATGELTPDQEQELKKEHGRVRKIRVKQKDGSVSVCYCKYPGRNIFALALQKRGQNKILEAGQAILENCFIEGDKQIKTVDSMLISASMECYELLDFLEASSDDL